MTQESIALYVVATPIGNLADIGGRALDTLRAAAWVAAEDTRHTQGLLAHYGIASRLFAAHEHNEEAAAQRIIGCLAAGESVALVSDAGTPGISDPGARIVGRVRAAGFPVVPIPGPCAAVAALSASGITAPHWLFCGFLPTRPAARRQAIEAVAAVPAALVFYEAPHRIVDTIEALAAGLGETRDCIMARELSKRFESIHRCRLGEALAWLEADPDRRRGEFVVVVDAPPTPAAEAAASADGERVLALLLAEGLPVKQAARLTQAITGAPKKALYERALALRAEAVGPEKWP